MRKKIIGVMGSSRGKIPEKNIELAKELGRIIAKHNLILLTGACYGLPYDTVKELKSNGGKTIGISAAKNELEHLEKYKSPILGFDEMIFTGFGDMGRTIINIRSSDYLIFIQGGAGTLVELGQAIGEKKKIGILTNTQGISAISKDIIKNIELNKDCKVFFETEPEKLITKLLNTK